jgi:hypothetical protein
MVGGSKNLWYDIVRTFLGQTEGMSLAITSQSARLKSDTYYCEGISIFVPSGR